MAHKELKFQTRTARRSLERGVNILADAVKVTLGPKGRYGRARPEVRARPTITNDGVPPSPVRSRSKTSSRKPGRTARPRGSPTRDQTDVAGDGHHDGDPLPRTGRSSARA